MSFVPSTLMSGRAMRNRTLITSAVGYMSVAFTILLLAVPSVGWLDVPDGHGAATMLILAFVLGLAGLTALVDDQFLDAIIFFGALSAIWSAHAYVDVVADNSGVSSEFHSANFGWLWFVCSLFVFQIAIPSIRAGRGRFSFLGTLCLALLTLAVGTWAGLFVVTLVGRYLVLGTGCLAAVISIGTLVTESPELTASSIGNKR
jgi:succinate-acetate transporter protein